MSKIKVNNTIINGENRTYIRCKTSMQPSRTCVYRHNISPSLIAVRQAAIERAYSKLAVFMQGNTGLIDLKIETLQVKEIKGTNKNKKMKRVSVKSNSGMNVESQTDDMTKNNINT